MMNQQTRNAALFYFQQHMVVILARIELHTYKSGSSDRGHGNLNHIGFNRDLVVQRALASRRSNGKVLTGI
jgi:hypothetical protein